MRSGTTSDSTSSIQLEANSAVADDFQRKGIGTRLLEQLAQRAAAHSIEGFIAEVLPENQGMLTVFENIGFHATRSWTAASSRSGFRSRQPSFTRRASFSRDRVAAIFLRPEHSRRGRRLGATRVDRRRTVRDDFSGGFTGAAYPVNRSGKAVARVRGLQLNRRDQADPVKLCVIWLEGNHVIDAAEAALAPVPGHSASFRQASPRPGPTVSTRQEGY